MSSNLKILNIDQIENAPLLEQPFSFSIIDQIIKPEYKQLLIKNFPDHGFQVASKSGEEKDYHMYHREYFGIGEEQVSNGLDEIWHLLFEELKSKDYISSMSKLVKRDLFSCNIGASFWYYDSASFLVPHTDKLEKIATHLIYLNEEWDTSLGGNLNLLNSCQREDVYRSVVPIIENSVVLVTSKDSWHSVEPVTKGLNHRRKSLQIVFWSRL